MLLNQCLAISLSPIQGPAIKNRKQPAAAAEATAKEEAQHLTEEEADKKPEARKEPRPASSILSASEAASVFKQLVDQNSASRQATVSKKEDLRDIDCLSHITQQLGAVIERVEFAGFVLPSWLLLSGSYNDLHYLKTSWSEGNLKSPAGFRIETIGNIRSVNIDYFGNSSSLSSHTNPSEIAQTATKSIETQASCQVALRTEEVYLSSEQQEDKLQRASRSHHRTKTPKFASLNEAIIESVIELRRQFYAEFKLPVGEENWASESDCESEEKREEYRNLVAGVHIGNLIEHLNTRYANQIDLPPVEFIDCAINGLVRSEQLVVRPMTQEQMQKSYLQDVTNQQKSPKFNNTNLQAQEAHYRHHHRSVFVDQLIEPSKGLLLRRQQHQKQAPQQQQLVLQQQQQTSGRTASDFWSSNNQAKSKSTTLDSGIQSWDLGTSPTYDISLSTYTGHQTADLEFRSKRGDPEESTRARTTPPTTTGAPSQEPHDSHRHRGRQAEQVAPRVKATIDTGRGISRSKDSSGATRQRGFSLTRSLSFRPKKSLTIQRQQADLEDDRWRRREEEEVGQQESSADGGRATEAITQTRAANKQGANLTSLFRSKSMRIISSGKGDRFRRQPSQRQQQNFANYTDNETEINCDYHQKEQQQQQLGQHLSRRDRNWNDLEQRQDFKASKRRQATTSTIDYLATAQPHKRSLSVRRNSFLPFGTNNNNTNTVGNNGDSTTKKEANELGGGRVALFLRKLFSVRRSRSAADRRAAGQPLQHVVDEPHLIDPMRASEELARAMDRALPSAKTTTDSSTVTADTATVPLPTFPARTPRQALAKKSVSASPTSSSASSGSNSLIEILDCSPAVNRSKRTLREEEIPPPSNGLNRATWRLVQRSHSSLSQNSETSCSTTKSTVSQQLRRHLDEAYKRHRNCTNRREKEFIDSINVLRQASRHALQNSRSPSKSRPSKSGGSSSRAKSSASDDTQTTASSLSGSSLPVDHIHDELKLAHAHQTEAADTCMSAACHCKRLYDVEDDYHLQDNNHPLTALQEDIGRHEPPPPPHSHGLLLRTSNTAATKCPPPSLDQWQSPTCGHSHTQSSGCCLCSTYQQLAATCPLSYYPGAPTPEALPTQLACCCFATGQHRNPAELSQISDSLHLATSANDSPTSSDLCCPLWRSMLYAYCQPIYPPPLPPPNLVAASGGSNHQQQQVAEQIQHQLENHYLASSHQQNQYNTTIDLKIEIGADFKKKATRGLKLAVRGEQDEEEEGECINTDESSGAGGDDSLDSSGHQTDESLAMLSHRSKTMNGNNNYDGSCYVGSKTSDEDEFERSSLEASLESARSADSSRDDEQHHHLH